MDKKLIYVAVFLVLILFIRGDSENSMGTYSVKPSFKTVIDYDFIKDYDLLKNEVKTNLANCLNEEDIGLCVDKTISEFNNAQSTLVLSLGSCDKGAKRVFYDFVENYELCYITNDADCICEFSLDFLEDYGQKGEYMIKLSNDGSINLEKPEGTDLAYNLDYAPFSGEDTSQIDDVKYIEYFVDYEEDGSFKEGKLHIQRPLIDKRWDYDAVKLYKSLDGKLVFVEDDNGKKRCAVTRNIFKFCAVNKNKQFYVYDPSIDKEKPTLQNPVIKFALYMEDMPPAAVKGFSIQGRQGSDKIMLIQWNKLNEPDLKFYSIYQSKSDFIEFEIRDHKAISKDPDNKQKITPKDISVTIDEKHTFKKIYFGNSYCNFDSNNKKCNFLFAVVLQDDSMDWIELNPGDIFYMADEKKYLYVTGLADKDEHNFALTAIDVADNEIDNLKKNQKLVQDQNYIQAKLEDKLAPGIVELNDPDKTKSIEGKEIIRLTWSAPTKNIDGSNLEDNIERYNIYYENSVFDDVSGFTARQTTTENFAEIDYASLQKGKEYLFAVTAIDANGNEHIANVLTKSIEIT